MEDKLKEYKEIKDTIAELEIKKAECEIALFDEFDHEGIKEKLTSFGRFCLMGRKSYEYSPKVAILAQRLSKLKKIEEISNIATLKKHSQYIRMIPLLENTEMRGGEKE